MPGGRCTPDGICTVPCHGNTQACGDNHWVCKSGMCEKHCYYAATDCHWSQVVVLELHHSETSLFSYLSECLSVHGFCLEYTHEVASKFKIMWFRQIITVQPIKWNIKGKWLYDDQQIRCHSKNEVVSALLHVCYADSMSLELPYPGNGDHFQVFEIWW